MKNAKSKILLSIAAALLAAGSLFPSPAHAANPLSAQCALDMRVSIRDAKQKIRTLDSMRQGQEFSQDVKDLISEFAEVDWELATTKDARQIRDEMRQVDAVIYKATKDFETLVAQVEEYKALAQRSGDKKAMRHIREAQDALAAGSQSIQIMKGLVGAARSFATCVLE